MTEHRYKVFEYTKDGTPGGRLIYLATVLAENVPHAQQIAWERWPKLNATAEYPRGRAVIRAARKNKT